MGNRGALLKLLRFGVIWIMALCATACQQNIFSTEKDLIAFVQDQEHGYTQHKTINGVDFSLTYRPTDLLVNQELGDTKSTEVDIEALRSKYGKHMYFNLSMSQNDQELLSTAPKDKNEFGALVNQLAFGMGNKVHLYTKTKDTLELVDFVYPRMYGMSKATTIMFVYPRNNEQLKDNTLSFTVEDLGLYTGEVKFKIDANKLTNEPRLSFN